MLRYKTETKWVYLPCMTSRHETERVNSYNPGARTWHFLHTSSVQYKCPLHIKKVISSVYGNQQSQKSNAQLSQEALEQSMLCASDIMQVDKTETCPTL